MNFFEHQDRARRKTGALVALFAASVVGIVAAVNLIVFLVLRFSGQSAQGVPSADFEAANLEVYLLVSLVTVAVIGLGSLVRLVALRQGGRAVAKLVGARRVNRSTESLDERVLLNTVEEMAIASGTMVPEAYVMDGELGINAFAAGYTPDSAIITVTEGTLKYLDRDELQGVIGHEFSHILNGDMRLNIRLIGVLAGILVIGQIGFFILRGLGGRGRIGSRRRDGRAALVMMLVGVGLAAVGYAGLFFGRLIKSAVSRQREYLADASAVQFTRNPQGIAQALNKIRANQGGSLVQDRHSEELSHMFFSEGFRLRFLSGLLATHPPLETRIKRILPSFDLNAPLPRLEPSPSISSERIPPQGTGRPSVGFSAEAVTASVGNPSPRHLAYAQAVHWEIPASVKDALAHAEGARAVVYCLLLAPDPVARERQINSLANRDNNAVLKLAWRLADTVHGLGPRYRLPLLELAMAELKTLSGDESRRTLDTLRFLIETDARCTLQEFVVLIIGRHHLSGAADRADRVRFKRIEPVAADCGVLFSLLAEAGCADGKKRREAFGRGVAALGEVQVPYAEPSARPLVRIESAMDRLRALVPRLRESVVRGCAEIALYDQAVTLEETELLRTVSQALDCPMPPLLQG
jgi:Zn-dependent protease with chaperone function